MVAAEGSGALMHIPGISTLSKRACKDVKIIGRSPDNREWRVEAVSNGKQTTVSEAMFLHKTVTR